MTDFTKIKSKYVKNKIKGLEDNKKNRQYIEDLMLIESAVMNKIASISWARRADWLRKKLAKEYYIIGKELNPKYKTLKQLKEEERLQQEKEDREYAEFEAKEREESKITWKKMSKNA